MTGNAKDICKEEAKAREKVALAENEYSYTGKPADERKVHTVMATPPTPWPRSAATT